MKNTKKFNTVAFRGFAVLAVFVLCVAAQMVIAGPEHSTGGWAWSASENPSDGALNGNESGLGWLSMNRTDCDTDNNGLIDAAVCGSVGSPVSNYGVNIPSSDGALSGYGWSERYGWVSFNSGDVAGCAPAIPGAQRTGNALSGGARIISVRDAGGNSGGWDGCISLSGAGYGVTIAGNVLNGFAWSSDIGWIDFTGVRFTPAAAPTVTVSACLSGNIDCVASPGPKDITAANQVEIRWNVVGATACAKVSGNGLDVSGSGSGQDLTVVEPGYSAQDTFSIACGNVNGTTTSAIVVRNTSTGPSISATTCTIAAGASTCSSNVTWSAIGLTAPSIKKNGVQFDTNITGINVLQNLSFGNNTLAVYDGAVSVTSATVNIACAAGSNWVAGQCVAAAAPSIAATTCTIAAGASTCSSNVTWSGTGIVTPRVVHDSSLGSVQFSTAVAGNESRSLTYGANTLSLFDGAALLDDSVVNIGCAAGSSWVAGVCVLAALPGNISANPTTVPGNGTSTISWNCPVSATSGSVTSNPNNGDSWSNLSGAEITTTLLGDTIYVLACDGVLQDSVSVNVNNTPNITASKKIVNAGSNITITWDTAGSDPGTCKITGGALTSTHDPLLSAADSVAVAVWGTTRYTIECQIGGSDSVLVEVVPRGFES